MSDVYGNETLVPEYQRCAECGHPMTTAIHMINSRDSGIRAVAHKFKLLTAAPQAMTFRVYCAYTRFDTSPFPCHTWPTRELAEKFCESADAGEWRGKLVVRPDVEIKMKKGSPEKP